MTSADAPEPSANRMRAALRSAAGPSGRLRYDRFLELALYAPGVGYYVREGAEVGPEADFYTAAHVSPLFGATLAERARRAWSDLGEPSSFQVVELGPGDGTLARDLLAQLARHPPAAGRWEYVLCERSGVLRAKARVTVAETAGVRTVASLAALGPVRGFVFANELLDAQPARRFLRREGRWHELGVEVRADRPTEVDLSPDEGGPTPVLPAAAAEGAVYEASPRAEALLREVADHLEGGSAVLLDYGAEDAYWTASASRGTLAAYRGHHELPDPLEHPGDSDLSTWVNFTRVRRAAREAGLAESAFSRQAEALGRWGYERLLRAWLKEAPDATEGVRRQLASKNLLFGFDRFFALELRPDPSRGAAATR